MNLIHFRLPACLLMLNVVSVASAQSLTRELITVAAGDLPIILTAPHGGRESIPDVPERKGKDVAQFKNRTDTNTDLLAAKIAKELEKQTGKRPYVVIARFHRKYLDANRRKALAYESENAMRIYDAYQRAIMNARQEIAERWGRGLLLDIHGQSTRRDSVFRGTQNGKTTKHLVGRFGLESLTGDSSLFGRIADAGLPVIPRVGTTDLEHDRYDGGYTVMTHGSWQSGTIDAIQLETGTDLRKANTLDTTAEKLATAIAGFADEYLPNAKRVEVSEDRTLSNHDRKSETVFADSFSDSTRDGWFELDDDASNLSVKTNQGQLGSHTELNFVCSQESGLSSLKSIASHFRAVRLSEPGESISLTFDARHDTDGFVNRGFRFGLFDSNGSQFSVDGDFDQESVSLDDRGYFAIVDLGSSTSFDSAVIREQRNSTSERMWDGQTLSSDNNGKGRDPLMFTRNRNFTYSFLISRRIDGRLDIALKNNVSGSERALTAKSAAPSIGCLRHCLLWCFGFDIRLCDRQRRSH